MGHPGGIFKGTSTVWDADDDLVQDTFALLALGLLVGARLCLEDHGRRRSNSRSGVDDERCMRNLEQVVKAYADGMGVRVGYRMTGTPHHCPGGRERHSEFGLTDGHAYQRMRFSFETRLCGRKGSSR